MINELSPEVITAVIGIILSLVFSYFPSLNTWYASLTSEVKSVIMIGMILVVAVGVFVYLGMPWVPGNIELLIRVIIFTLIANQATYTVSPETKSVTNAKIAVAKARVLEVK